MELEQGDIPDEFNTYAVFEALMQRAKEYELLDFLARTPCREPPAASGTRSGSVEPTTGTVATTPQTILEAVFGGDWASMMFPQGAEVDLLTYSCRAWLFGARLSEQYNMMTSHVLGNLLKSGDHDLAHEFLRFMPDMAWSHYLRARVCLMRSEFAEAFIYFKQAAPELGEFLHAQANHTGANGDQRQANSSTSSSSTPLICLARTNVCR